MGCTGSTHGGTAAGAREKEGAGKPTVINSRAPDGSSRVGGGGFRQQGQGQGQGREQWSPVEDLRYNMLRVNRGGRFHEHFELQEAKLGEAAQGCVVRGARKRRTGEMFACKTFMVSHVPKKSAQKRVLATLRNEIDLLRSLDHPNIVRAYESYEVGQDLHLVMELCAGGDLNSRTYTEVQAATVVRQVLSAIHHSHQKGICHRDLKFENILFESTAPDAQIKLIDFGMSARFQEGTKMSERVGSVYTMAPEVLEGEYTKQADLWSVGCITFHLIAGESPFECEDETDTMKKLLAAKYFWSPRLKEKVSSEAKWFVWHLLKKVPALRWTAEQAINSDWIKTFAPTGSGGGGYGAISPPPTSSSSTTSAATASSSSSLPALAWPSAELMPVGDNGGEGGPAVGVEGPDATPGASQQHHRRQQPSIRTRMVSSMRDYCKYGALRRTALMVVAYNQAPEKLRELRNEFSDFDTKGDGKVSAGEMEEALAGRGVGHEEIQELFTSLDVDRSGDIHYLEFLAATIEAVGSMEEEGLRHAFERLDTDDSGYITVANFKELVGPIYDDEDIRKTLEEADVGKDGKVAWDDFLALMRSPPDGLTTEQED